MKWRSSSSVAILLFFAALFASVDSSPSGKKESLVSAKTELEKKINPSSGDEGSDDDLLARAKKSSTTTTFCVEIKPGDAPAVVVCDPSKTDHQVPIPNEPAPHHPAPTPRPPTPAPYHETPNFPIPSTIPNYFPAEYPRGLDPEPNYEPLIFIPQQPQIIQPQIIPPYYQPPQILQPISAQPQIIVIPNAGCPSNSPSIISNPNSPKFLYSRSSAQWNGMMEPSNYLRSAEYNPEGDMMRSIPAGSSFSGLLNNNGYSSPLDLIYSKRGNNPQLNPLTNTVTLSTGGPALVNTNQNFDGQYNRPVLIQCNPKVIPLSQEAYAAAVAGKANVNDQDFKSGMETIHGSGPAGHLTQYMYQPGVIGQHGVHSHQAHGGLYNHQKGFQMQHNVDQYHQSNMYPYNKGYGNAYYKTASEFGPEGRAAENTEEAIKSGKVISVQQGQMMPAETFTKNMADQKTQAGESQHISQASFNEQGLRGVSGGDGKVPYNQDQQQQQQKMGGQKQIEGNQNSETRFTSSSFSQGQNSFVNGDRISKDQGLQKQMGFSQNQNQNLNQQQQQQVIPNAPRTLGMEPKNSQQSAAGNDMQSYSQMLLQRMKSAVGRDNLVQPFMVPSSGLAGEKQSQVKV